MGERRVGPIRDSRHGFGDGEALRELLESAGLQDVRVRTEWRTIRFSDGATFARMNAMAIAGMSAAGKALADDERASVAAEIAGESADVLGRYTTAAGLEFKLGTNIASGR